MSSSMLIVRQHRIQRLVEILADHPRRQRAKGDDGATYRDNAPKIKLLRRFSFRGVLHVSDLDLGGRPE